MSEHKARERREARMADEAKERANMLGFMACIIAAGVPDKVSPGGCVKLAREILAEAHVAEGLDSPFPPKRPPAGDTP